jgi:hypothetical protein
MKETDELLPTMMRKATERLDQPDAADLVERGMRRGRQLRRRRTVVISLAAASAVALAAAGAFAAGKLLPTNEVQVATSPSVTPSPKAEPVPSSSPTDWSKPTYPSQPEPETSNPSEAEILATLRAVVPEGFTISDPGTHGSEGYAGARLTVDDGNGATELAVSVSRGSEAALNCPADPPVDCQRLPDGSVVNSMKNVREYMEGHPSDLGVIYNTVTVQRTDGLQVNLVSRNAPAEKRKSPTRKQPPFSVEELIELARDARWKMQ